MRRWAAALALLALLGCTTAALLAPLPVAAALLAVGATAARHRRAILVLGGASLAANLLLFGLFGPGTVTTIGWIPVHGAGIALAGATALRLTAVAAVNLGGLARVPMERLLDGLRLPPRVAGTLAAVALCARDVGRDAARLVDAAKLDGAWPARRLAQARTVAALLPALLVASVRRAETRREALRLAGQDLAPAWTPIVAVGALTLAGRFALLAVPNVSVTYAVVFLGGVLFGARVGALAGLLGMLLSDLVLTGLQPTPLVNGPAMALLGLLGGALRGLDWGSRRPAQAGANRALAAAVGVAATLLFSVAADALTWAIVPEYRAQPGSLRILVAAGLLFNVLPAVANALLFGAATAPTVRAWRAVRGLTPGASPPRPPATAGPQPAP
ncbi:MAG TPA: DUF6580 family putative transport protein [Candidatus Thermoplasmatota archaeon]|nr:DUF6580 family putative transport protein [Candidatus Thermoplasmatota archaeon]